MFGVSSSVFIQKIEEDILVISSLQRPRKIGVRGSDGHLYHYLLKAHDDLQADHRIMQFFRLMSRFVKTPIPTFAIVPFTSGLGIVQWVPNATSQSDLVKRYSLYVQKKAKFGRVSQPNEAKMFRDFLGVSSKNEEGRPMPIQRLEAFRRVLSSKRIAESVNALRDVMWISAPSPETWLRYQRNFSKTCAVTSMIGYIVGLGDRHSGNILIEEETGRVVHIDFGLCFEFTHQREWLREFVPFRLTRMIVAALGPQGQNGVFRRYCEETLMKVRQNRESILALLQIFQWRPLRDATHLKRLQKTQTEQEKNSRKFSEIYERMKNKVQGTEFGEWIKVEEQVRRLIQAATDEYNLCRMYTGWVPWH
jgi:phosphatidylinositol kinase/protein kinase (PI-3  family)